MGGGYLDGPALETFTGWAALGYDHGYDGEEFYLGLALAPKDIEGFVALRGTRCSGNRRSRRSPSP
jgi:uncharacterized membrane protein